LKAWIYIFIAALFQSMWGITLKMCQFGKIGDRILKFEIFDLEFLILIIPAILYLILGLIIVIFVSKAYKLLPMSIVYAAWMGLTIFIQSIIDLFYFKEVFNNYQFFFVGVILIGIIGMKINTKKTNVDAIMDIVE
jgi:multidrug transporter EmrE-like cation transporter